MWLPGFSFVQYIPVRSTTLRTLLDISGLPCDHSNLSSSESSLLALTQTRHMLSFLLLTHATPAQYIRRDIWASSPQSFALTD